MRVLVACSGGPDSAALLFALAQLAPELGLVLECASVDHGLRPDAQRDVAIARSQAEAAGVRFHALRVDVGRGASVQGRARVARYAALLQLAQTQRLQRTATGHTSDDQAETVLLRLLRGSGVRGLSAIEPLREDGVMRPMIDATRADAHAYARAHAPEIAWDASNDDPRFERTRARHALLPALRGVDPALDQHLARLADEARDLFTFVDEASERALQLARVDAKTLKISALAALPAALRDAVLRAFLSQAVGPISGAHLRQAIELCQRCHGEVWLSDEHCLVVESAELLGVRPRAVRDPSNTA